MASIVGRPLNRLRRSDTYKPLHERWGDVAISAPTDGSWNQFDNPHQSSHRTRGYGPGFVPEHPPRGTSASHTEDPTPSTRSRSSSTRPASSSRHSTFSMSTLNPRRLSVRLAPRPRDTDDDPDCDDPRRSHRDRRTEFAYKPIIQDYPTEVAEHVATTHDHPSPRFRYIPATPRYGEDMGGMPSPYASSSTSSSSSSTFSRSRESMRLAGPIDRRDRDSHSHSHRLTMCSDDLNEEDEHEHEHEHEHEDPSSYSYRPSRASRLSLRAAPHSSADYTRRASSLFGGRNGGSSSSSSSSSEKKRYRASGRYMTTDMVPDADEMYG